VEEYILLRAGLLDEPGYLFRLSRLINRLQADPARRTQSAEESSLDAWLERYPYYWLPQRSISYYNKGAILGVLLDLRIREATNGAKSLRDLFRWMNQHYAKTGKFFHDSEGVRQAAETITGADFQPFFRAYVAGVEEIPYDNFFAAVGLKLAQRKSTVQSAGFTAQRSFDPALIVTTVESGSQAEHAGLRPGDRILLLNDKPVLDLETVLSTMRAGETLRVRVSSTAGERDLKLKLGAREEDDFKLVEVENPTAQQLARRAAWLGVPAARKMAVAP
jgi:predicted metalloprotease with PDZ domain